VAERILAKAEHSRARLILPQDCIVADDFSGEANHHEVLVTDIPDGWQGLDIGPQTAALYADRIAAARSLFWNGPMGVFEIPAYAAGTRIVGEAIAAATRTGAHSVVGGGDSVAALNQLGLAGDITHISTGGGASLEYMAGMQLPGVAALSLDRAI
jgi:phosphoglycerate kinase